jgi:hypothetical protein
MRLEETVMGSLLAALAVREEAARARVEQVRAELAALTERLAAEEEGLRRLQITRETVGEVLGGAEVPSEEVVAAGGGRVLAPGPVSGPDRPSPAAVGSSGLAAPLAAWRPGADAGDLPVAYRRIVQLLAGAGEPLRAMQVCQTLGVGAEPRHREGMRVKLERLVARGWLAEAAPGLFACAPGGIGGNGQVR